MTAEHAAQDIAGWALCDSMIQVDVDKLSEALEVDVILTDSKMPNAAERMQLVCGDDSGEVPTELVARFPCTHALLGAYWE